MKYLCLVYFEEKTLDALSKSEWPRSRASASPMARGSERTATTSPREALQPVRTAMTLRVRNGQLSTTDGPFAETKEQLGGFYLIEARDLDEAIQVASRIPPARLGSIEVRPIRELTQR